jgi:hypothetical protein
MLESVCGIESRHSMKVASFGEREVFSLVFMGVSGMLVVNKFFIFGLLLLFFYKIQ